MRDRSVVGLDLITNISVHVEDASRAHWQNKGHNGDGTLVCWHCYHGTDALPGTQVPLLYKGGRTAGKVRPYFAHPPRVGPPGGHHPETVWHADANIPCCGGPPANPRHRGHHRVLDS
ncbi:hypothetical protein ACFQX7_27745 [Luedemannella flava]